MEDTYTAPNAVVYICFTVFIMLQFHVCGYALFNRQSVKALSNLVKSNHEYYKDINKPQSE